MAFASSVLEEHAGAEILQLPIAVLLLCDLKEKHAAQDDAGGDAEQLCMWLLGASPAAVASLATANVKSSRGFILTVLQNGIFFTLNTKQ